MVAAAVCAASSSGDQHRSWQQRPEQVRQRKIPSSSLGVGLSPSENALVRESKAAETRVEMRAATLDTRDARERRVLKESTVDSRFIIELRSKLTRLGVSGVFCSECHSVCRDDCREMRVETWCSRRKDMRSIVEEDVSRTVRPPVSEPLASEGGGGSTRDDGIRARSQPGAAPRKNRSTVEGDTLHT